jgi:hypothetical protein
MGSGYKGNTDHYHSISENLPPMKEKYFYKDGYFGNKGNNSKNNKVRHIESCDPSKTAKEFYDTLTHGGKEEPIYDKKTGEKIGKKTTLADGSVVAWRKVSSSDGSPAVDINIEYSSDSGGIKQQKIHFVKGENGNGNDR